MSGRLELRNLHRRFDGLVATDNVSLTFEPGSLSAIIGPNGAGKTTLFHLISGRLKPTSGRVILDGQDITGLSRTEIVRRGIARAFQVASLFGSLTIEQSLVGAILARESRTRRILGRFPPSDAREKAASIMALVGLTRHAQSLSRNLSHGDQKLLDIALALALEPKVLLLDEPTAGMGPEERWRMIERVHALWERRRMTLVFIEHDMDIVFKIAESVRVLRSGAVLAEGRPEEIRNNPAVIEAYLGVPNAAVESA